MDDIDYFISGVRVRIDLRTTTPLDGIMRDL